MYRERQGYDVVLAFVTRLFNVFYNNNILKCPLNGQQMTEVKPVLHSHTTAQATNSPCCVPAQYQTSRRRICGGISRTEKGFLRDLLFAPLMIIPPLLHIHLFICL